LRRRARAVPAVGGLRSLGPVLARSGVRARARRLGDPRPRVPSLKRLRSRLPERPRMTIHPTLLLSFRRVIVLALSTALTLPLLPVAVAQPGSSAAADPVVRQKEVLRDVLAEL